MEKNGDMVYDTALIEKIHGRMTLERKVFQEDENLSVKLAMAGELQKIGLPARAISRLLSITCHRR